MSTGQLSHGLSQRAHRQLIGYLGLAMPVLLVGIAGLRPTDGLEHWEILCSISAYYYTGATGVFTGILFALSLFLVSYKGYTGVRADRIVGSIGGAAALGVALFPTAAPDGLASPSWWSDTTRVIHYLSALTLFASFILFAAWLFRRSNIPTRAARPAKKRRRDDICLGCGIVMVGAVLWAASSLVTDAPIFIPEAIAIGAFAVSWLVKGEAPEAVIEAFRAGMKKLK